MSGEANAERWRPILGWEGIYEVSDHGRVRSLPRAVPRIDGKRHWRRGQILKPSPNGTGHAQVGLALGGVSTMRLVHRMVLLAFVGEPAPSLIGCHNDGDPTNNHLSNLRWDTRRSNNLDTVRHGGNHNANQTHCKWGHEFAGQNLRVDPKSGKRSCRECGSAHTRAHYYRQKAKVA